jgi:hypothetical protein
MSWCVGRLLPVIDVPPAKSFSLPAKSNEYRGLATEAQINTYMRTEE